jgi:inosose dehydratase
MSPDPGKNIKRREFLETAALSSLLLGGAGGASRLMSAGRLHVSCNSYTWQTFYEREKRDFDAEREAGFAEVARSGLNGYEPAFNSPGEVDALFALLKKNGLEMRSLYVSTTLHKADAVEESIRNVVAIAEKARPLGTRIVVTNPSPIRWGGPQDKDDEQLKVQAAAMDRLGARLRALGVTLAYHNHDIELRNAAREFHHMMVGTDPKNVSLCLDVHWVYRGAGNSSIALFDVLKLYGARVRELHLRQSVANVWSETFGDGDIDYRALATHLATTGIRPHLVLEQAPEKGTPRSLTPLEAHRRSREYVEQVFGGLGA